MGDERVGRVAMAGAGGRFFDRGQNLIITAGAKEQIHLGQCFDGGFAIALGQAASNDQTAAAAMLFVSRGRQNGLDGLVGCILDKAAGIDNDGLRLGRFVHDGMTRLDQPAGHDLAVDLVAGASEINQV